MKVFVSTSNFSPQSVARLFGQLDGSTYKAVEISSGHPWDDDRKAWTAICEYVQKHLAKVMFHNHAPPGPDNLFINLSDPDDATREKTITFLKSRIDLTKEIGSDYYSFHGGYRVPYQMNVKSYDSASRLPSKESLKIFIGAAREVVQHAETQGVHIGVENHAVERGNENNLILYGIDDFQELLQQIPSDFLHVHLDVGHLKVTSQTLGLDKGAFLRHLGPHIMTAHVHENEGQKDSHQAFGEDFWFLNQLEHLPGLTYACLETDRQNGANLAAMQRLLEESAPQA